MSSRDADLGRRVARARAEMHRLTRTPALRPQETSMSRTIAVRTVGVSPKAIAAVVVAVITYVLGQEVVDLPTWIEVIGQAVLVAIAAYTAPPGTVRAADDAPGHTVR